MTVENNSAKKELTEAKFKDILARLDACASNVGLEIHPFKVGWYNDVVGQKFHLPYDYDAVAFLVISQPSMFEKAFLPFVRENLLKEAEDGEGSSDEEKEDCPILPGKYICSSSRCR